MPPARITTDGEATATARAELARVRLRVDARHDDAGVAHREARDREAVVRDALSAAGVDRERVRTTDLELEDREEGFEFAEDDPDYRAVVRLAVDCVPETVEDVVVAAADAGAAVERVTFDVGDADRETLERRALEDAMRIARGKAEAVAAAEGLEVGPVLEATTERPDGMERLVDEALVDDDAELTPSPVEVDVRVEVSYELREPEDA